MSIDYKGALLRREHNCEYDYYACYYLVVAGKDDEIVLIDTEIWTVHKVFKNIDELIIFLENDRYYTWEVEEEKIRF